MKTLAAVIVSVCLVTGCTSRRGAWSGVAVGLGTAAIGGVVALVEDRTPSQTGFGGGVGVFFVVPLGGVIALASLINVVVLKVLSSSRAADEALQAERARIRAETTRGQAEAQVEASASRDRRRDLARTLTKTAAAASRDGNCEIVRKIDHQVLAIDSDVHATEFLVDLDIKSCVAPSPIPTTPTPQPPVP